MFAKTRTLSAALIMSLFMTGCQTTEETKKPEPQPTKQAAKPAAKPAAEKAPAAAKKPVPMPQIIGKTNKSALSYQPGEEMIFTFKMDYAAAKPGKYFLSYLRRGDDNKSFSGKVPADQTLTVKT